MKEKNEPLPLVEGCGYVNPGEYIARLILEVDGDRIIYADYGWPDGTLFSSRSSCSRSVFRRWAGRRLSPEETAKLSREQADDATIARAQQTLENALRLTSDEQLMSEVRRRGLLDPTGVVMARTTRSPKPKLDLSQRAIALLMTPPVKLDMHVKGKRYTLGNADDLRRELESLSSHAAAYAAYLDQRINGQSHDKAVKKFNKVRRMVRNALGYFETHAINF